MESGSYDNIFPDAFKDEEENVWLHMDNCEWVERVENGGRDFTRSPVI